jgi:uncharacterized protein YjiS (DUF1127 family)
MPLSDQARSFPDVQQSLLRDTRRWLSQQLGPLRRVADAWMARRDHAQSMAELASFTDRELRDIALTRTDVAAIAKGEFRRD